MTTLLAIGDIHLGRLPAALPEDLSRQKRDLGPEAAWKAAVTEAINRKVDAVLLAGDVVERSRDFLVAYGQLKDGIEKLATAGIPVLAVAGNHDTHVLPRLAAEIDALHLLGADGHWEHYLLERGSTAVTIAGWSFPTPQVHKSPLKSFPRKPRSGPVIGLLHCDRDQTDSVYAPVSSQELAQAPTSAWLLGHIHQPDSLAGPRPIGYLGSVSALRASEIGPRGPWLIRVEQDQVHAEQIPLAPLRYEAVNLDCTNLEQPDQLPELILASARTLAAAWSEDDFQPQAVGLRVTLTGTTDFGAGLLQAAETLLADRSTWRENGIDFFVQKMTVDTTPAIDLTSLARQNDPCGLLARRLLILDQVDHADFQALVDQGRKRLEEVIQAREFRELGLSLSDADVAAWLRRAAHLSLTRLVAQRSSR